MKIMVLNDLLLFLLLGQSIVGCLLSCKNGGNLWQIIKQRNKKYRNLQTTFKGMEKSVDRESERKIPGMSHGSKN
jgi:hypothetical protein